MLQRPTQTSNYWVEDFQLQESDIEHLYNILLERETPLTVDEMALALVRYRVAEEEEDMARLAKPKDVYRPRDTYKAGATISFPQYDFASGKVLDVRTGQNPDYGEFPVIRVEFEDGAVREFPSGLTDVEHVLNDYEVEVEEETGQLLPPEELFIEHGGSVADALEERLDGHSDLVRLAGRWFPRSLLVDINVGYLNLAEAILDMSGGGPMPTAAIIEQTGILEEVNPRLAEFSMNYVLQEDKRFDEVGPAGEVLWYLVRMEPEEVHTPPPRLAYKPAEDLSVKLPEVLLSLEDSIQDEHSDIVVDRRIYPESVTVTLTYPHLRAGTLPLSPLLRRMFPTAYEAPRIRFNLFDPDDEEIIPAWVVRPGGYVYGLSGWFEKHKIPVGGYLTVERTDVAGMVNITYAKRNPRKEWVRSTTVENERVRFENRQTTIGCDYDDLMIIHVPDEEAVDRVWQKHDRRQTPLHEIMMEIARELAQFNPQGNIHAKTLYSAVNLVRRTPPGPVFARLVALPDLEHVGGPYWRIAGDELEI